MRVGDPLEPRHGAGVSRVRVGMVRLRRAQERVLDVLSLRVVRHVERAIVVEPRARRAELPPVLAPPRRVRGAGSSRACRDHAGERSCSMQHGLACSRRWARCARELATARTARQRSNQYLLQLMRKNALDACSFQNVTGTTCRTRRRVGKWTGRAERRRPIKMKLIKRERPCHRGERRASRGATPIAERRRLQARASAVLVRLRGERLVAEVPRPRHAPARV